MCTVRLIHRETMVDAGPPPAATQPAAKDAALVSHRRRAFRLAPTSTTALGTRATAAPLRHSADARRGAESEEPPRWGEAGKDAGTEKGTECSAAQQPRPTGAPLTARARLQLHVLVAMPCMSPAAVYRAAFAAARGCSHARMDRMRAVGRRAPPPLMWET